MVQLIVVPPEFSARGMVCVPISTNNETPSSRINVYTPNDLAAKAVKLRREFHVSLHFDFVLNAFVYLYRIEVAVFGNAIWA